MTVEAAATVPSEAIGRRTRISLSPLGWVCIAYLVVISALALLSPLLPTDPSAQDLSLRLLPPFSLEHGWGYFLGGDELGRSIQARVIAGGRVSLTVGLLTALIAMVIGVLFGVTAAIAGGAWEWFVLRLVDIWMSLPTLLIALVVLYALGGGVANVILVLAALRWVVFARVARALTLSIKERQYFDAARSIGASMPRLIWKHVIPNMRWDILTVASLEVARAMLTEAALSFLGLGVQPPQTSWGLQLANARGYLSTDPWLMFPPGLAILFTTLSINLLVHVVRTNSGTGADSTVWMGTIARRKKKKAPVPHPKVVTP